jgi:DNA polymerase III delta prime subunit
MNQNKKHTLWVELYRPDTLENYICNEENREKFSKYITDQDIPHLMFIGKPGSGKTTIAKILAKNINCDYLYLNATDERSMETIRNKVGGFASSATFKPLKIVILDEATHLLEASQVLLLNMIETYSLNTRFIFTGNFVERLIEPLRSRCQEFDLTVPSKKVIAEHVDKILEKESVEYEMNSLVQIINRYYPDLRKIVNNCQKYTSNNILALDKRFSDSDEYSDQILKELNQKKVDVKKIRQIVTNAELSSYEDLYKLLFSKVESYGKGNEGEIIILLSKMNYESSFVTDKELNIASTLIQLAEVLNRKVVL